MKQKWGRERYAGAWPSRKPWWTIAAVLVAVLTGGLIDHWSFGRNWTPLQRYYAPMYAETGDLQTARSLRTYTILALVTRVGTRLAQDTDVIETGESSFSLAREPAAAGAVRLEWQRREYENATLHALLRHWIYRDRPLDSFTTLAFWVGFGVLVVGLWIAVPRDLARARERRTGRRLKGPELVGAARFNRRSRADGVGFLQLQSFADKFSGKRRWVRLPRTIESSHVLIMGDTGTGKSALIRQILLEIEDRGETAIVYDPALEYTPQFLNPSRGDLVLNPLDQRTPYWTPGDELRHAAEALTLAASLFPDRHNENPFFIEGPRKIFAHLLTFRPTPEELVWWMSHPEEIDQRVKGTEYEAIIDAQSPPQRNGVLGSLNMVADALKLLPSETETTQRWSALQWSKDRRGWLFLTSTPETRKRLLPLVSLWLDTLVLRLMNQVQAGVRPVWLVLDELASLQRLPQLHTAITENRKSNNPVVLGFQGRSQLETRYGHEAEAMLSQPATKIFLRTSEPRAAKWISDTIGEVETERLRESRSTSRNPRYSSSKSYNLERQVEPLILPSEVTGLESLHGYLKCGNMVVRMSFPFIELPQKQPKFVERPAKTDSNAEPQEPSERLSGNASKTAPQEVGRAHREQLAGTKRGQGYFFE